MKTCLKCQKQFTPIDPHAHNVKYCSALCRENDYKVKYKDARREGQREKWGRYQKGRLQCRICSRWYRQLGTHVYQRHEMSAIDYKKVYGLDIGTGMLSPDLKEIKKEHALENGTYKNLEKGAKYRYRKGDRRIGRYKRSKQTLERLRGQFERIRVQKLTLSKNI